MPVLDQLETVERDGLIQGVVRGDYSLLLGAGASRDSYDSSGKNLPLASDLTQYLMSEFGLTEVVDLPLAYERAVRKSDADTVYRSLRKQYTQCIPADWVRLLPRLVWRGIWTLNIDDVISQAYSAPDGQAWQSLRQYSWDDRYQVETGLQLVHLHGRLLPEKPHRLVFSISEYLQAREEEHTWHRVFGDTWASYPFITIGARLVSEYDLAKVFRTKRSASSSPSIFVSPKIEPDTGEDLREWGLVPVQATGAEFVRELLSEVEPRRTASARVWSHAKAKPSILAAFASQFRQLTTDDSSAPFASRRDFFQGDPPLWEDIVKNRDAPFSWVSKLDNQLDSDFSSEVTQVHVLLGPRFSGRTVGLLRIAAWQSERHRDAFLFRPEQRINVPAVAEYLKNAPPTLLVFDGLADFADDIRKLLDQCRAISAICHVVATEYEGRARKLIGDLGTKDVCVWGDRDDVVIDRLQTLDPLSRDDAGALVKHLQSVGRLNELSLMTFNQQVRVFVKDGLFAGLARAEFGAGFRQRIQNQVLAVTEPAEKRLLVLACVCNTLEIQLPISLAAIVGFSAIGVRRVLSADQPVSALLICGADSISPRHRRLTLKPALELLGKEATAEILSKLARDISPLVNAQTQRQRTIPVRIAAGLMRAKGLVHWIGTERLMNWYEEVAPYYLSNSRFWEQRALATASIGNWAASVSFAKKACDIGRNDPWRLNTLGTILLRRAVADASGDEMLQLQFYKSARHYLQDARRLKPENEVPIDTFLTHSGRLVVQMMGQGSDIPSEIRRDWSNWLRDAQSHPNLQSPVIQARIDALKAAFLRSLVTGVPDLLLGRAILLPDFDDSADRFD